MSIYEAQKGSDCRARMEEAIQARTEAIIGFDWVLEHDAPQAIYEDAMQRLRNADSDVMDAAIRCGIAASVGSGNYLVAAPATIVAAAKQVIALIEADNE